VKHQHKELMAVPGIEMVGLFPSELQGSFMSSAALVTAAQGYEAAKDSHRVPSLASSNDNYQGCIRQERAVVIALSIFQPL
jgi:hypothetical protein